MQIIESTIFGVRSARITLEHEQIPISFTLYPMIHIGEASFYTRVREYLENHDLILTEGVNSPIVKRITTSYRWAAAAPRLDLVLQSSILSNEFLDVPTVNSDLNVEEFENYWSRIPIRYQLLVHFLAPIIGFRRRYFATRNELAENMSVSDLKSRAEILSWDARLETLYEAIMHARDRHLVQCIAQRIEAPDSGLRDVAIVFGGAHMPAVLDYLIHHRGYVTTSADWLTVFRL